MKDNQDIVGSEQIEIMQKLGFSIIDTSYSARDKWMYVKQITEYPPHLTNGKSYLQLSRNQAKNYLELIEAEKAAAIKQFASELLEKMPEKARVTINVDVLHDEMSELAVSSRNEAIDQAIATIKSTAENYNTNGGRGE